MHHIVPFSGWATSVPDAGLAGRSVLPPLPHLGTLLAQLAPPPQGARDEADEWSLSPPHERALARALGLAGADGCLPWAARQARADGLDVGDLAWGLLTPCHWHLGTEQLSLVDPAELALDADTSRALLDAVRELFTSEGYAVAWGAPLRWYLAHESLAELPTASLDRVVGRNVDAWLGQHPALRRLRRLQSELQMLLYGHPLNAAREAAGQLPVNSVWLSGCGVAQPEAPVGPWVCHGSLRAPALAADAKAWASAWAELDAGALADAAAAVQRGEAVTLTLCGERAAATFGPVRRPWWQRLTGAAARPAAVLEAL